MNSARFGVSKEASPHYDSLVQNLLDLLVSQSEVIVAAAYRQYDSVRGQFSVHGLSVGRSAPQKYRTLQMILRQAEVCTSAGEGFLRDQIVEDGITRLVVGGLTVPRVYRLKNGRLLMDASAFPPDKAALKAARVANYLQISTQVPRSEVDSLHTGIITLVITGEFDESDAQKYVAVFEECERLVHSEESRKVFEGIAAPKTARIRDQVDVRSKVSFWQRRKALLVILLTLLLTVPAVWFGITLGLSLVVETNENIVAVVAVLAEITVAIVLWAISERRRR